MKKKNNSEIIIYKTKDGANLEIKLKDETLWLSLNQISYLFNRDKSVISRHISNIYTTKELKKKSTVAKNATVRKEGNRNIIRQIEYFNLDMILSIGYRVNSKRGTQFRIWATKILKQHLIKGFTINQKRLKTQAKTLQELKQTIRVLDRVVHSKQLSSDESQGLFQVISDYTYALDILDNYDHQNLKIDKTTKRNISKISFDDAMLAIDKLKEKSKGSDLFGLPKDSSFTSSINTIYQSFNGKDLYPSIEEKAANLLYFIVKNHSFIDGNKRIAAFIFIWFMDKNKILYSADGSKRLADNALVALTLMIAQSKSKEKEIIVKVIVNLINKNN